MSLRPRSLLGLMLGAALGLVGGPKLPRETALEPDFGGGPQPLPPQRSKRKKIAKAKAPRIRRKAHGYFKPHCSTRAKARRLGGQVWEDHKSLDRYNRGLPPLER